MQRRQFANSQIYTNYQLLEIKRKLEVTLGRFLAIIKCNVVVYNFIELDSFCCPGLWVDNFCSVKVALSQTREP